MCQPGGALVVEVGKGALLQGLEVGFVQAGSGFDAVRVKRGGHAVRDDGWASMNTAGVLVPNGVEQAPKHCAGRSIRPRSSRSQSS